MTQLPDSEAAIETRGLLKRFGRETLAVDGVDLRVRQGAIHGLVGPDGAGKTTLIRMLSTVLSPTGGEASVLGHSVVRDSSSVKPLVGYMSQDFGLYPDLTVAENLRFFAELRGVPRAEMRLRATRSLDFSGLTEFANRRAEHLSGGMKQKLALAVTLMHEPRVLFLDEPTTGVDPVSRREFWRIISGLHRQGITVFVATPYMDEAERCSRVSFMENGRIVFEDSPGGLKTRVPGTLYEVDSTDERGGLEALKPLGGILSTTVHGEVLRVLVAHGGPEPDDLKHTLARSGITVRAVRKARIDMEATFAYLAEESRVARRESSPEPLRDEGEVLE